MEVRQHQPAPDSPCGDHWCDACPTCRKGRCCRKDNPDYKLPEMGDWDGPIFGRLGVLADDGTRGECHACGRYYHSLAHHAILTHYLLPEEYRAIFGLNRGTGLIGPALRERRQIIGRTLISPPPPDPDPDRYVTREQRAANTQGKRWRLEARISPANWESRLRGRVIAGPKISATKKADPAVGERMRAYNRTRSLAAGRNGDGTSWCVCVICRKRFLTRYRRVQRTCSPACRLERRRQFMRESNPAKRPEVALKIARSRVTTGENSKHFPAARPDPGQHAAELARRRQERYAHAWIEVACQICGKVTVQRKSLVTKTCKSPACVAESCRRYQLAHNKSALPEVRAKISATKRALAAARLLAVAALP